MLTIISVSYRSKALLEMNYRLVRELNPGAEFRWIVVQNSPPSSLQNDLGVNDDRFELIRGPVITDLERESVGYGSFHHAKALNMAINYTDSDLVLTIDPDCFILMPHWIERVTQHVRSHQLGFFGAPNHPRHFRNYRGFPNPYCMFINRRYLQELNLFTLNFMPECDHRRFHQPVYDAIQHHIGNAKQLVKFFTGIDRKPPLKLSDWPWVIDAWVMRHAPQLKVGRYTDTGVKMFRQYHSIVRHEQLAVYALDHRRTWTKVIESCLPDAYRTFPRDTSWIHKTADPLLRDFEDNCEQFYWRGQLFAFHVNGTSYSEDVRNTFYSRLIATTAEIVQRYRKDDSSSTAGESKDGLRHR